MTGRIQKTLRVAALVGTTSLSGLLATPAAAQCVTIPGVITTCTPATPTTPIPPVIGSVVPVTVTLPPLFNTTSPIAVTSAQSITVDALGAATITSPFFSPLFLVSGNDVVADVTAVSTSAVGIPPNDYLASGVFVSAADMAALTLGSVTTTGNFSDGIDVVARTIDVDVGSVATTGLDSDGVVLATLLSGPATLDAGVISTSGNLADGINIVAGTATVSVDQLSTAGVNADGVEILALTGPAALDAGTITTLGPDSTAAFIQAAGDIGVEADVLRTGGDRAAGLDLNTNLGACAIVGPGGTCDVDAVVGEITTGNLGLGTGANAIGALIVAAGDIDLDVGVLTTNGADAVGVNLASNPTVCAVLLASGGCETDLSVDQLTTNGPGAIGALIRAAGPTTLDIGILETRGANAPGVDLALDPTACVQVGIANCGTDLDADTIRTLGANSAGVLLVSPAAVDLDLGTVDTLGANAPAVSIAGRPELCLVAGAGTCNVTTTAVDADNLITRGPGSAGLLITSPTQVVANLGTVQTLGLNAPAVSIVGDPRVCVLLGPGACNASLTAEQITTDGAGSLGVLINSPAQVVADLGLVDTDGANSPGVTVITDPTLCLLLGAGACGVVIGDGSGGTPGAPGGPGTPTGPGGSAGGTPGTPGGTNVDTDGNNSPGIVVVTPGPVDVDAGTVTTDGNDSPGIRVDGGEGPIDVDFDVIDTDGANSPGVDVGGFGPINVGGGSVQTDGANSPGIVVTGDNDPVRIDVTGPIVTTGPNSDGIDVGTTTGPITILAGPITVTGAGSNGIDANAAGCADVSVTARGPISSTSGLGIDASSACNVTVITQAGATVAGGAGGINVVSDSDGNGTGTATIDIGAAVSSTGGPALNADGGPASVLIRPAGVLNGRFDLTNRNDGLINNGVINAAGNSDFGAGFDTLVNGGSGRINVTGGTVFFTGLEQTVNSGLIDLRDGAPNDTLVLSGNFVGAGGSTLGVDVGTGTGISDQLNIAGAATGSTVVLASGLNGGFVNSAVVANAGAGTSPTAFTFTPTTSGLVDYSLVFLPAGNDFAIFGTPNINAVQVGLLNEGAREVFYRGNDAVAAHLGSGVGLGSEQPGLQRAFWFQGFGMVQNRDRTTTATPFGQPRAYNLDSQQDFFGGQVGVDLFGGAGSVFGVTAGYIGSNLKFDATPLRLEYEAANVGAYGRIDLAGFTLSGLVKYEKYWIDVHNRVLGLQSESDGEGWGGFIEAGYRFGGDGFFVEPLASIEYANIDLDGFTSLGTAFAFDEAEGVRGKAGVRFGAILDGGPNRIAAYGKVQAIHEFEGDDELRLTNSGLGLDFDNDATDTYGRGTIGVDVAMPGGVRGFIEGSIDFAGDVSGGGARGGLSIPF